MDGQVKPGHDRGEVAIILQLFVALAILALTIPASALDINSFRAQHHLPALAMSSTLAGLA
jgi:hypothetical protein